MKKIDFHIHTVATPLDAEFEFDISKLQEYVQVMALDGIAITNHNVFDITQFRTISNSLSATVLPGIEINLGKGHALLIGDSNDLQDFSEKCQKVETLFKAEDSIDVDKLREIFGDLSKYLIIPHYDKKPRVDDDSLEALGADFIAGEVSSAKKLIYAQKSAESKTPVLFSDSRAQTDWDFKARQTYLDVGTIDVRSLRLCLSDKSKVALSTQEGSELIQVTPEGVSISSGLTVLLGGRSSGKSHTLDEIAKYSDDVKYIRQFDLIEIDPEAAAKKFKEGTGKKQHEDGERYLKSFRAVVDDIKNISLKSDDKKVEEYVDSLLKSASEVGRHDLYSKTALFAENPFHTVESDKLVKLIEATETLLSPGIYAGIVEAKVPELALGELLLSLIEKYRNEELSRTKQAWVNNALKNIQYGLNASSATTPTQDVDLLEIAKNKNKVERFRNITKELQKPRTIDQKVVQRFTIQESSVPISGAQELKDISGHVTGFRDAFNVYGEPYDFLQALKDIEVVESTSYHKFFTKIEYSILNEYGVQVSGGERAEFKLISEIDSAGVFDLLLIDEPESSFDNLFLCGEVNKVIKAIAQHTPVVVVTHNNTIGASIKPNHLIYTEREINKGVPVYKIYSGKATDNELVAAGGEKVNNSEVMLRYLEAGKQEYDERGRIYEMLES